MTEVEFTRTYRPDEEEDAVVEQCSGGSERGENECMEDQGF